MLVKDTTHKWQISLEPYKHWHIFTHVTYLIDWGICCTHAGISYPTWCLFTILYLVVHIVLPKELNQKNNINIPFGEALEKMPVYAKFLEDLLIGRKTPRDDENI